MRALKKRWKLLSDPAFRAFRARIRALKKEQGPDSFAWFTTPNDGEIAFDFGGYEGDWTQKVSESTKSIVHVFEPHPRFAENLSRSFAEIPSVFVHDFALGSVDGSFELADDADASSAFETSVNSITCQVRGLDAFMAEHDIKDVAITKMNIEGGEYDLLSAFIESGWIASLNEIAVQFHDYGKGEAARRDALRKDLAKTHDCIWNYEFVWEFWRRRTVP